MLSVAFRLLLSVRFMVADVICEVRLLVLSVRFTLVMLSVRFRLLVFFYEV